MQHNCMLLLCSIIHCPAPSEAAHYSRASDHRQKVFSCLYQAVQLPAGYAVPWQQGVR